VVLSNSCGLNSGASILQAAEAKALKAEPKTKAAVVKAEGKVGTKVTAVKDKALGRCTLETKD